MQPSGDLICLASELSTGVQGCHHDLERGPIHLRMIADRDPPAIIGHRNVAVFAKYNRYFRALTRQSFVYAVIDDFDYEVMQADRIGVADVHRGTSTHGVQTFKHLNRFGGIRQVALLGSQSVACDRFRRAQPAQVENHAGG